MVVPATSHGWANVVARVGVVHKQGTIAVAPSAVSGKAIIEVVIPGCASDGNIIGYLIGEFGKQGSLLLSTGVVVPKLSIGNNPSASIGLGVAEGAVGIDVYARKTSRDGCLVVEVANVFDFKVFVVDARLKVKRSGKIRGLSLIHI